MSELERIGEIVVRAWRVTGAEPHGMMMWFDPASEVPSLRSRPHDCEDGSELPLFESGTPEVVEGVPCEGRETNRSEGSQLQLGPDRAELPHDGGTHG